MNHEIQKVAHLLKKSSYSVAFTGAGISVESGIPPFRGAGGIWHKYDPKILDVTYFSIHPKESWKVIKEIFYDSMQNSFPNNAHKGLAELEKRGLLKCVITQNIDNLHQKAGNKTVYEYHGNSQFLTCTSCGKKHKVSETDLTNLPPKCNTCKGILKPDFVFFGEGIPQRVAEISVDEAYKADLMIIIGTTGDVMPANLIPSLAKQNGSAIVEINTKPSNYTHSVSDIFLEGEAGKIMKLILKELDS